MPSYIDSFKRMSTEVMATVTFNTGRKYTAAGQRIVAFLFNDGTVIFRDVDRCIDGVFTNKPTTGLRQSWVMQEYDYNRYEMAAINPDLGQFGRDLIAKL